MQLLANQTGGFPATSVDESPRERTLSDRMCWMFLSLMKEWVSSISVPDLLTSRDVSMARIRKSRLSTGWRRRRTRRARPNWRLAAAALRAGSRYRRVGARRGPAAAALVPVAAAVGAWAVLSRTVLGSVGDKAMQQNNDLVRLCSVVEAVLSPIPAHRESTGYSGATD